MNESNPLDPAVIRRVEAMVHAGHQPQGDEAPVAVLLDQRGIAEQVLERVRRALDLKQFGILNPAVRADDGVAGTDHDRRIGIGRPQARAELPGKAIVQALEAGLASLGKIELGKQPPARDRQLADSGHPRRRRTERFRAPRLRDAESGKALSESGTASEASS